MASATQEERTGARTTYIITGIFSWLGALIGWLVWKDKGSFAKDQTTEALNFGITTGIGFVILSVLTRMIPMLGILSLALWIVQLVLSIMAAGAAGKGESYRYPFSLRLIK
ncbi:DUF4870 domain-containing protein [Rhodanobacter sp. L36]|uniref:DUF4870 domain-containing protein n=1 Tax=Rhodanobacter sp. L36 TaxID=1747221 RepID=UPI0020B1522B|nr:DUF4870 domain-containing protein [Rhodanobacter sp. L36]